MADDKPSTTDLFSSAKLVAEAAQATFQGGSENVDKKKVAGAASGLLGAASDYGNLRDKGYGQYVDKAESYLDQYSSGGSAPAPAAAAPAPAPAAADTAPAQPAPAKAEGEGTDAGNLLNAAKGFLGGL